MRDEPQAILLWPLDAAGEEIAPTPLETWRGKAPEPPKFHYVDRRCWRLSLRWPFVRLVRGVIIPAR